MSRTRLRVGGAGLGQIGKRHALNFLEKVTRAELVATFSSDETEITWARTHLEPFGVKLYMD